MRKRPSKGFSITTQCQVKLRFDWIVLVSACLLLCSSPVLAAGREMPIADYQFRAVIPTKAVTIREAVQISLKNYPTIAQTEFKLRAAKGNIQLAKTQYLPNLNVDFQESAVTPNRIASVVMNNVSGFDTVPVDSGPPATKIRLSPEANSLQGLNFNWLLIDQGLRKANDKFAYADAGVARATVTLTKLDVAFAAASAFLDALTAKQAIRSTTAKLQHMQAADLQTKTLVAEGLRAGVDLADWDYEVAKAQIDLIRAERDTRLSLVELAEKMGIATNDVDVISYPLIREPVTVKQFGPFDLNSHPMALAKSAEILRWRSKEELLDKSYRPHLWLNASVWGRGSGSNTNPIHSVAGGILPQVPDYMIGLTYSFPIMEYFPLKAQRGMARSNELAAQADLNLALQILEKKDARARILLEESRKIALETPILVEAARIREIKVQKRYATGLTNMVSLAAAEKALADADVADALAQIDVWRSILCLSYVQGDLAPFLQLVALAEGSTAGRR